MRLATIQTATGPRAAILKGSTLVDLHATDGNQPTSVRQLLEAGPDALHAAAKTAENRDAVRYDASRTKLLPPIPDPPKIICIGLNYRDHAAEQGIAVPAEPVVFSKFATALIGHESPIVLPPVSKEVDYEAELVIVVGKKGRPASADQAMSYIAGYTIGHDVSARDWQLKKEGKQWLCGKSFDTFAPTGPVLVTPDELPDPQSLAISLRLNGKTMQSSNTKELVFGVGRLLAYLAKVFTLEAGDLIFTGTPPGVGFARKPPVFLQPGDVVEVEIAGIGILRNPVIEG